MLSSLPPDIGLTAMVQAVRARDPRFDGLFFVGITTTRIYCRPVCPSRPASAGRRRFFASAAAAEHEGYRPCLRCRPELAPGRAPVDAVSRIARLATDRIASGGLNGRGVAALARDLGVGERQLRRVLEREVGASPLELAQTHRLLMAKRLLMDTDLSITRIAFASGFQSLRRFNAVVRDRYRMSPSELRDVRRAVVSPVARGTGEPLVTLTMSYRPPLAWSALLLLLQRSPLPRVEHITERRFLRAVAWGSAIGILTVEDSDAGAVGETTRLLRVRVSESLVPGLMSLLGGLRRLFDLEAESNVIDAHLASTGLASLVFATPGLRVPGAFDGFEAVFREVLAEDGDPAVASRVIGSMGAPLPNGSGGVDRALPTPERIVRAGTSGLLASGLSPRHARVLTTIARELSAGGLRLESAPAVTDALRRLQAVPGMEDRLATSVLMRAARWPDTFPASDPALQRAMGVSAAVALERQAEPWRPWRAYAAQHLWLAASSNGRAQTGEQGAWSHPVRLAV